MSAPVDVLSVLIGAIAAEEVPTANSGSPVIARDLRLVRAAVAELMEAAEYANKRLIALDRRLLDETSAQYECELGEVVRLDAALARCKGGAA